MGRVAEPRSGLRDRFVESAEIRQAQTMMRVEVSENSGLIPSRDEKRAQPQPSSACNKFDRRQRIVSFSQRVVQAQRLAHVILRRAARRSGGKSALAAAHE